MSQARTNFLEAMAGATRASQAPMLLAAIGSPVEEVEAARLLRNGLSVAMFAAFEGFIRDRLGELADWLKTQSIPLGHYPSSLRELTEHHGVEVLYNLIRRDRASPDVSKALVDLGDSWMRLHGGGVWSVPQVAMLWTGSNLGAGDLVDVLKAFDVATTWSEISGIGNLAGFTSLPNQNLFKEISERRHEAAHQSRHDADVLLLRATPAGLIALAFAFDALMSSAVRSIQRGVSPMPHGRSLVNLVRLDEDPGSGGQNWLRYDGPVVPGATPVGAFAGASIAVAGQVNGQLSGPGDILLIRSWTGSSHEPLNWLTSGV